MNYARSHNAQGFDNFPRRFIFNARLAKRGFAIIAFFFVNDGLLDELQFGALPSKDVS